ncbi:MAG: hypothetical protein HY902_06325 [Deltaproteobacteria bacterium]|nr:hypothetical protein [Deltaproteobacteria bacterium]
MLAHAAVGQSWRPQPQQGDATRPFLSEAQGRDHERLTYLVFEPWYGVGGTLGLALSSQDNKLHGVVGAWEGYGGPQSLMGTPLQKAGLDLAISVAAGFRWLGGAWELYVTPKLGVVTKGSE